MADGNELRTSLARAAAAAGFDDIGYCSALPFTRWGEVASKGLRARIGRDPRTLLEGARSIVVAVRRYGAFGRWPEGHAEVANYYLHSPEGYRGIGQVAEALTARGYRAAANPALPAKQAAVRAGLGAQGLNTQFCHRAFGPLVSLHLVLTDAPLAEGDTEYSACGQCGRCAAACPTGAIEREGFFTERCLRQHMMGADAVPPALRAAMGTRLLGCTDCQHACHRANPRVEEIPAELLDACRIEGLLAGDAGQMKALARYLEPNYARTGRVRRQAAIAAGNSGNGEYVPHLIPLLRGEDAVLRRHAAWALGRLGGGDARAALEAALEIEREEAVREEIRSALNGGSF